MYISDVEEWLKTCVSEASEEESRISKEELFKRFCSWTKTEVGKELFFSYLGLSLSNLGYKNFSQILRKGQHIGYKGLMLLSYMISNEKAAASGETKKRPAPDLLSQLASPVRTQSKISKTVSSSEKTNPVFRLETVKRWMEKYYCEGEINDTLSKQELWLNFKDANQLQDSERSAFFPTLAT